MTYQITDPQVLADIRGKWDAASAAGPDTLLWGNAYQAVYSALTDNLAIVDPVSGNASVGPKDTSAEGEAIWVWVAGALKVNQNQGSFAAFIRGFTAKQYELRTGINPDDAQAMIQRASNEIAKNFIADVLHINPADGSPLVGGSPGAIPTLLDIGGYDASGVAAGVFTTATLSGTANFSPWAGTALFAQLGVKQFFEDWVLSLGTSDSKIEPGAYDLFATAQATVAEKTPYGGLSALLGDFDTYARIQALGGTAVAQLKAETDAFFQSTYGSGVADINVSGAIFDNLAGVTASNGQYIVGTIFGDSGEQSLSYGGITQVLHAGTGDDEVTFNGSYPILANVAVIDGGDGIDSISLATLSGKAIISVESESAFGWRLKANLLPNAELGSVEYLYNFEALKLSAGDDEFRLPADLSSLTPEARAALSALTIDGEGGNDVIERLGTGGRVDGGAGRDTIDYGKLTKGLTLDLRGTTEQQLQADGLHVLFPVQVASIGGAVTLPEDVLTNVEILMLTGKADRLVLDQGSLGLDLTVDMGLSDRDADFMHNVDVADYSAVGVGISFDNGTVRIIGQGEDAKLKVEGADKVILTGAADIFKGAASGTIVETGGGADTVWFTPGVAISDMSADDRLSLFGADDLYGGLRDAHSSSPYALSLNGLVEWGKNPEGDLIVRLPWYQGGTEMFLLNWEGQAHQSVLGGELGPGNISLAEYSISATRLFDYKPGQGDLWGTWKLFGLLTKTLTGWSAWGGVDPLVLDLNGNGIELTQQNSAAPRFDIDGDLYAEQTAWVKPSDGILARDLNGNGRIDDARELFGASGGTSSGFAALAGLDGNGDGKIDASDDALADFNGDGVVDASDTIASLKVWRDLNGNAKTDDGELSSLADLGIASISVQSSSAHQAIDGSLVTGTASFTRTDGTTGTVADVSLSVDNAQSTYGGAPITITAAAAALPELKGYGTLVSLREALSVQPSGVAAVSAALATLDTPDLAQLRQDIRPILESWAEGSPLRLADGSVVTGTAGLSAHADIALLKDASGNVIDYTFAISANANATTFNFVSGALVTISGNVAENGSTLASLRDDHVVATTAGTVLIGGVTYGETTYGLASGHTVKVDVVPGGDATTLVGNLFDTTLAANSSLSWSTLKGADIAFFERYTGEHFSFDLKPDNAGLTLAAMKDALTNIDRSFDLMAVRLAVQSQPLSDVFGDLRYDPNTDSFHSAGSEQLQPVYDGLFDRAATTSDATAYLATWKPFMDIVMGDYHRDGGTLLNDYGFLAQNLVGAFEHETRPFALVNAADALGIPANIWVTGSGTLNGTSEADIFYLDASNQTLIGGAGADNYIVGHSFGHDTIIDHEPVGAADDVLRFSDHNASDFTAAVDGIDFVLTLNATGETIRIQDEFIGRFPTGIIGNAYPDEGVSEIVFADGTTWSRLDMSMAASHPDDVGRVITGTAATDYLEGGKGNDTLSGGGDSDIYVFAAGDGQDVIHDAEDNDLRDGTDILYLKGGLSLDDLTLSRDGGSDDLYVGFAGSSDTITIQGQFAATYTGVYGTWWSDRIELMLTEDGHALSANDLMDKLLTQESTSGDDTIYGFSREDTLDGGAGNDFLSGGNENDTYIFGRGYGHDTIEDKLTNILSGEDDTVQFTAGLTLADLSFDRSDGGSGHDFLITIKDTGETLRLVGQYDFVDTGPFGIRAFDLIEKLAFADGSSVDWFSAMQAVMQQEETPGDDHVYGTYFHDVIDGGAGNDTLSGGDGSDTYVYDLTSGNDTIQDNATSIFHDDGDVVQFGAGIAPGDVRLERSGDDLEFELANGHSLTVKGQLFYTTFVNINFDLIENFTFQDGTNWTSNDLHQIYIAQHETAGDDVVQGFQTADTIDGGAGNDTLQGGDGSDTYLFELGFGKDIIQESVGNVFYDDDDRIVFGTGLNSTDAILTRAGDDLTIGFAGKPDQVTIEGQFGHSSGFTWHDVEHVQFADGVEWSDADLRTEVLQHVQTPGDDLVVGFFTADTLGGGAGNDTLVGGEGSDTYVYTAAAGGNVTIDDGANAFQNSDADQLDLTDLNPGDVVLSRALASEDLTIAIEATGKTLTIKGEFSTSYATGVVETIHFADGTVWGLGDINSHLSSGALPPNLIRGTSGGDYLFGTIAADTFVGGLGDDYLRGVEGSDTYVYASGDGNDTINDGGTGSSDVDVLQLTDLTAEQIVASRSGDDLKLFDTLSGETITLFSEFVSNGGVETIQFAGGDSWHLSDIASHAWIRGTAGGDYLFAGDGPQTIVGGLGDDYLHGGAGGDTYVYASGDGNDTINDGDGSTTDLDILRLTNLTADHVVASRTDDHLRLFDTLSGQTITIDYQFSTGGSYGVETIEFADGQSWDASDIVNHAWIRGTPGADYLFGSANSETLVGGLGDDYLHGGVGADTYVYTSGDGNDTISDGIQSATDIDVLHLTDLSAGQIVASRVGDDLKLLDATSGQTITVNGQFDATGSYGIEQIDFADGQSWDSNDIISHAWVRGTANADFMSGQFDGATIDALGGDDAIYLNGNGGATILFAAGDGQDSIYNPGSGYVRTDTLKFLDAASSDVALARSYDALDLSVTGTSDGIHVGYQFWGNGHEQGLGAIQFADGVVYDRDIIRAAVDTDAVVLGTSGAETLAGTSVRDALVGGHGNDVLTGNAGSDVFVFGPSFGQDTITDFAADATTGDHIVFDHGVFSDAQSALAAATQVGTDVVIAASATDQVTLNNVMLSQLSADHFIIA